MNLTRKMSFLRRATTAVAAVVVVGTVTAVALPQARGATVAPLFEEIGTLDRFADDARAALGKDYVPTWEQANTLTSGYASHKDTIGAIMIPELRQLWQIYYTSFDKGSRYAAVVRDLDTLEIEHTVRFADHIMLQRATQSHGGEWANAVDVVHDRLFLVTNAYLSVLEIDLKTFTVIERPLPNNIFRFALAVGGMTYDPYEDDLLVLYGGPPNNAAANSNTFLYTMDLSVLPSTATGPALTADTALSLRQMRQIRSCTAPVMSTDSGGDGYNWEILVTQEFLYVPCSRAGYTGIVVKTKRATSSDPQPAEASAAGPTYVENALADQAAGRIVMTTFTDKEIWIFEAATMSFVGIAATSPPGGLQNPTGYGLDPATGRVFFQSPAFGLGVVEARFFPLPQGRRVNHLAKGRERIMSDARTNRIFVLEGHLGDKARAWRIYRTQPAPVPPPAPDPDRNTADVAEKPGVTEARLNATASGYGARVVWANGFATVPPTPTLGVQAPTAEFILIPQGPACGFTDREVVAARVFKTEYDTGSTAAQATALDVDESTKQDLDKPSRCDFNGALKGLVAGFDATTARDDPATPEQETRWRWERASCSTSEGGKAETGSGKDADAEQALGKEVPPDGPINVSVGPSTVSCPEPGGVLTASATTPLGNDDDSPLRVGRAWTTTKVERLAGGGVRSRVESVAQDVSFVLPALTVTFAEVRSTATSFSNGRPFRGSMSEHKVSVRGARIGGDEPVCGDPCEGQGLTHLMDLLNTAAAGRAQFRTGAGADSGRDQALFEGSRKGAQTAVQKSQSRQASDRALVGDFTVEVPALEVTTFNDNTKWGRARQLYQLAGVATAATYNVVVRPTGLPLGDLGPFEGPFGDVGDDTALPETAGVLYDDGDGGAALDTVPVGVVDGGDDDDGGGFWAPLRAVARGLRLFLTDPRHSLLLLTAWALLGLPGALSRRRRLLTAARTG